MRRSPVIGLVVLSAFACSSLALAASASAAKGGSTVNVTKVVNQPIPDNLSFFAQRVPLVSTITVGKQFRGRKIRDVNVTAQTIGISGTSPAVDLTARLTAPDGSTTTLWGNSLTGTSIGPLTIDDEAALELGTGQPVDPEALYAPYQGSAQPIFDPLAAMDGGPVRGDWTLDVTDIFSMGGNGGTSSLVQWRLNVAAGRPFKSK